MVLLYLETVRWTIPIGIQKNLLFENNILVKGRITIRWGTCVGLTISGSIEMSVLLLRRQKLRDDGDDLCYQIHDRFGQKGHQCSGGLCCCFNIFQGYCVVLSHFCKQLRVGFCRLKIGHIYFGLPSSGVSLCFLQDSCKVSFKVTPCFVESLFVGPLTSIILIEPAFFDVREWHRYNLGGCVRIWNRDRFLVPFNFPNELFENGFTQNWFLHPPINFLDMVIF